MTEQAEDLLREMVLNGELRAGERLNEVALADSIGISRGPLREAISRLAGQGLLTVETHRGAFVKEYSTDEIKELYQLREALELYSVRLAAKHATDAQLEEFAQRVRDHAEGSKAYVAEFDFHQHLVELGGNNLFRDELLEANHKLYLALTPTVRTEARKRESTISHREIVDALRARDVNHCIALLSGHLHDSMRNSLHVMGLAQPDE